MIPQYNIPDWEENRPYSEEEFSYYCKRTTITKNKQEAKAILSKYLAEKEVTPDVVMFVTELIQKMDSIPELHIVNDGSYRHFCWLLRPDTSFPTGMPNISGLDDLIKCCHENNTIFFLNLQQETMQELRDFFDILWRNLFDD
jgi:hypothetical protein